MTNTDPLGRVTTITDNTQGQPISIQDPAGNPPTTIHYNGTGDVTSTKDPVGNTTSYQPDADGRVISVTSPLNETTQYAYDALDDVTDIIDPLGHHTNYTYDLVGETASITPPNGFTSGTLNPAWTTTITRSPDLAKVTVTDPLGNSTVTDLDGQGRHTDYTDKRGIKTTYAYDLFGRVKQVVFNSNTKSGFQKETVSISDFDPLDRPGSIADSLSGTLSYAYDALDSILSEADSETGDSTAYSYDSNGRRTSMQAVMNHNTVTVKYGYDCADELIGMSNDSSAIASCSPSNDVTNGSNTTQAGFYYDLDGMPQWTQVDGILTNFVRDADERIISESYSAPAVEYSYGNLTYGYDPDGNLTDKGGSLATINLPPSNTASYDMNDQLTLWNAGSAQTDAADNITVDPASGLGFQWSARNQVLEFNCCPPPLNIAGPGVTESYDAAGRRETSVASTGDSLAFLHDGSAVAGWYDSGSGNSGNFFEVSGATLAGDYKTSAGTTTWVPLTDSNGSTIALVNPASPNSPPATTYTYNPSGMPSMSGQPNNFPFLFEGMENELTDQQATVGIGQMFYTGSGQFYSAQIGRSLSLTGALDTGSPGGPGPDRAHHGGHHGGGGGDGHGAAINGHTNVAGMADDAGEAGTLSVTSSDSQSGSLLNLLLQGLEDLLHDLTGGLFDFGGGPSLPPFYFVYQARLTRGGRRPQYTEIDGAPTGIILSQASVMTSSDPIKGEASSYNLPGMTTANGEKFDPNAFTAAMNGVPLGTEVTVAYNPGGNVTKEINVRVNDRGPFAVDNEGRALRPLQPHPTRVIDLTPAAMKWLTGKETNLINVTVLSPAEKSEPLP